MLAPAGYTQGRERQQFPALVDGPRPALFQLDVLRAAAQSNREGRARDLSPSLKWMRDRHSELPAERRGDCALIGVFVAFPQRYHQGRNRRGWVRGERDGSEPSTFRAVHPTLPIQGIRPGVARSIRMFAKVTPG